MTDDIVARLRRPAPDFGLERYDPTYDNRQEAADEIDRLRAKIQQLNDSAICINNDWSDAICENFDLREENAELRETAIAALKEGEKKDV